MRAAPQASVRADGWQLCLEGLQASEVPECLQGAAGSLAPEESNAERCWEDHAALGVPGWHHMFLYTALHSGAPFPPGRQQVIFVYEWRSGPPFRTIQIFHRGLQGEVAGDLAGCQPIWLWASFCHMKPSGSRSTFEPGS